jgi:CheY-like chemotaxis protein
MDTQPLLTGKKVLIVDDNDTNRLILFTQTQSWHMEPESVSTPSEALSLFNGGRNYDLVILDMQMPDMDGYQATHRLRENGFSRPIIALTAGAMKGDREKCLNAGCSDYLAKPIDRIALVATLARHIDAAGNSAGSCAAEAGSAAPASVLVVDDSEDACQALATMLQMFGYRVLTAFTGQAALANAQQHHPGVVILDLNLPDISGFEVARSLSGDAAFSDSIFIALSGEEVDQERLEQAGFDHSILKPASVGDIVALFPQSLKAEPQTAAAKK